MQNRFICFLQIYSTNWWLFSDGQIRIFTEYNKYKPFLEVTDSKPITDLNLISFSAYYRDLDYYYNCSA